MKFIIILCALFVISAADVSELSSNKYLPPGSEQQAPSIASRQDIAPEPSDDSVVVTAEETAVSTSNDDDNAAPAPEAPAPSVRIGGETAEANAPEPEPAHELKDDGYQYKTVRRIRYRYRT